MIHKHTVLATAEKSGVWSVFVFHLYKGFNRRVSYFGDYTRVSIRDTKPNNWLVKKTKKKSIIIRTMKEVKITDGSYLSYQTNSLVLLKKRLTPEGVETVGPICRTFKKKKFISSFTGVI